MAAELQLPGTGLWVRARQVGAAAPRLDGVRMVLNGEARWLLRGPAEELDAASSALVGFCDRLAPDLLELGFGNAVGLFGLGAGDAAIEVVSGKWDRRHFDGMLADVTRVAAALPFAADAGGALPYDRSLAAREDVLYHAFVYLRHILMGDGTPETKLLPALGVILREPHRQWRRTTASVPVEEARWVDPAGLEQLVQGREPLLAVGRLDMPLARALGGHVPRRVDERRVQSTVDTPENRFVKAFLDQADGVVEGMRRAAQGKAAGGRGFPRRVLADCEAMARALAQARHDGRWLWDEVGRMTYLPAGSTVLQMRRGYRDVLGHFVRLRMATRLPLSPRDARQLLELKDIALLYELWTYFMVVEVVTKRVGPPIAALTVRKDKHWGHDLQQGMTVTWPGGLRLAYNLEFAPKTRGMAMQSYSVPLRPDIALTVADGPGRGLHLLDAKFRLRKVADLMGADEVEANRGDPARVEAVNMNAHLAEGARMPDGGGVGDPTERGVLDAERLEAEERRGTFKRADLYKMHTYRDAIHGARSVWALYPGDEARFFSAAGGETVGASRNATGWGVPESAVGMDGVGALPLVPGEGGGWWVERWVAVVLGEGFDPTVDLDEVIAELAGDAR